MDIAKSNTDTLKDYKGIAPDTRSEAEKAKDYTVVDGLGMAAITPVWESKTWTTLSLRKQITSSSCGAQSLAKILEFFNKEVISATPLYRFRSNFAGEGMFMQDIGNIGKNKKTTTEALCPSQNMTESQMNAATIPDLRPIGISGYYNIPVDMDLMATALEKGHGLILGISSTGEEWQKIPFFSDKTATFHHYVACVDKNYILHNGEKSFVIDDSCNAFSSIEGTGQRILTQSFLRSRCWAVLAIIPDVPQPKPSHVFNTDLIYGDRGDEVKALQQCLIHEGLLKSGFDTGYFGSLSLEAVKKFQLKYKDEILTPAGLTFPTGQCRKMTRKKLNSLYSS